MESDTVIDEMERKILRYRHTEFTPQELQRWARHLVNVVRPQLEELAQLKANAAATKVPQARRGAA